VKLLTWQASMCYFIEASFELAEVIYISSLQIEEHSLARLRLFVNVSFNRRLPYFNYHRRNKNTTHFSGQSKWKTCCPVDSSNNTADNGKEFTYHDQISKELDTTFYFTHPYSSLKRRVVYENINGLIRQHFSKKDRF